MGLKRVKTIPARAAKKIRIATTDSFERIAINEQDQPGVQNILHILALVSGRSLQDVAAEYDGQTQYGPLKTDTAEAVANFLRGFQERLAQVDDAALLAKLTSDEAQMNEVAGRKLLDVQKAVGLR